MHMIKTLNGEKTTVIDEKIYFPAACHFKVYSSKNLKNKFLELICLSDFHTQLKLNF